MTVEVLDDHPEPITSAKRAYQASLKLGMTKGADRSRAVLAMALALERSFDDILEANTLDLEASREMAVPELILDWLKLTPTRLETTVDILQRLGDQIRCGASGMLIINWKIPRVTPS
jgi:glutamate-5-semialdehyde dehydrogenase